ncbi:MAG: TonB-dependent receptor [Bacteroidetes bacterium]|nr:TonB-dependent receptor [Bacteroidota bacterium]
MRKLVILLGIFLFNLSLWAQKEISGIVSAEGEGPLIGATVQVKGTSIGTITDFDGHYSLQASEGSRYLIVSYVGYGTQEIEIGDATKIDIILSLGELLSEIVVIGSRGAGRTNTDSPVPVDVINVAALNRIAPQSTVNSLLSYTAPSFNSNTQTISDGTDHIDPASLGGLGPDQVLVLLNGKRRHTTSLVNVNGTFGRGSVGTDLNAIPATAIRNIEVLRDGAAAQYGSDAIAGVINLNLKNDVNKLSFNVSTGANLTSEIGAFGGEKKNYDGEVFNLGVNYGIPLGSNGGFINLTGEYLTRGKTNRMLEFEGGIFSVYNGVERVAAAGGVDISALTLEDVQKYAPSVGYLSSDMLNQISDATDLGSISDVLGSGVTDQELSARGQVRSDYNMLVGQSGFSAGQFFANMSIPLGNNMEIYSFGGIGYREGQSGCFYRLPSQNRTTTSIYINGTVPKINSNIIDQSFSAGIRGMVKNWNIDLSNTFGRNEFLYRLTDSHNATLGPSSPTAFDIGGHSFTQNTANFDVNQYIEDVASFKGINVAFGAEYRYENYSITPGSEASYGNFDINGNLVNSVTPDELKTTDIVGRSRPAGCQCFSGFLPSNVVNANRSSVAGYADFEVDFSEAFLLGIALRAEDYSDFGSTFNYKAAARYKITNDLSLRGAISTGFRAPSLHQIYFSKTATIFELVNGVSVPNEVGTFANASRAAKLLGIPELKEEVSQNYSLGITAKIPAAHLKITLDAYKINIQDRVIFTGRFSAGDDEELKTIFEQAGANAAAFFSNAIDTKSQGIDFVIAHSYPIKEGVTLVNNMAATFSETKWDQDAGINASPLLEEKGLVSTYFDQQARIYVEQALPRTKVTLSNTLNLNKLSIYLRNTYFGEATEATNESLFDDDLELLSGTDIDPYYSGKIITDLSLGYAFSPSLSLTIGANNLLDVYPDEANEKFQSSGRFVYSRRSPQFSLGGRYVFARLSFTL